MNRMPFSWSRSWGFLVALLVSLVLLSGCATTSGGPVGGGATPAATDVLSAWKQADRLYASREFRKARDAYHIVLQREPDNTEVLFKLGNIAYYLQEHELARDLYRQVGNRGLDDPQMSYNLAALNLTEAYEELARYRDQVGPASMAPEVMAVMAAIERMSGRQPTIVSDESGERGKVGGD